METTKPCSACNGTGRIPRGPVATSAEILAGLEGHWIDDGSNCTCYGWMSHPSFERLTADPEQWWEWITTSTFPFWMEIT